MGKKNAPPPPDYMGAAQQQGQAAQQIAQQTTAANRPNQSNPYASSTWQQGPDGQWSQQTQFTGPWAGLSGNLQQQAASNMGTPLDSSLFGAVGNGDAARNQAINAAYGQAASRLDPQWDARQQQERTMLMNQGLDPSSQAFQKEMTSFGQQRNDAYTSAMNSAIGQGTAAGNSVFQNNMAAHNQAISDALRQREQPMQDIQSMNGLLGMNGFQAAQGYAAPNLLGAAQMAGQYGLDAWNDKNQAQGDFWGGLMQLAGSLGGAAIGKSDARAKRNIRRLAIEALPGVPYATWDWADGHEGSGPTLGVIAQDLEAAGHGKYVFMGADGFRRVDYSFLSR